MSGGDYLDRVPLQSLAALANFSRMFPPFWPWSFLPTHLLNAEGFFTNLKGGATETFIPPMFFLDDILITSDCEFKQEVYIMWSKTFELLGLEVANPRREQHQALEDVVA